uniref:Transmembrane protein 50A-like n=1 Tax=Rhizophora mucronata TaxID=61149 RepID=A0A2P2IY72_RHIMU
MEPSVNASDGHIDTSFSIALCTIAYFVSFSFQHPMSLTYCSFSDFCNCVHGPRCLRSCATLTEPLIGDNGFPVQVMLLGCKI